MEKRKFALVLPAGGARAAFQVGVLKYVSQAFPEFQPTIFCGISAGAINTTFLAQGEPFPKAVERLHALWMKIRFEQVLHTNFTSMWRMGARFAYDLFLSKLSRRRLLLSMLDASPLAQTLLEHIHFWRISRALRAGIVDGVCVTATNYHIGAATVFFDSHQPIQPWVREQRRAIRTNLRVRHVMASCSIPLLFEPIRIGDYFYGDGSLRFNYPFSPALQMGATDILSIGIRCPNPQNPLGPRPERAGMGFVAGAVLNSLFLDSLEVDFENVQRINALVKGGHPTKRPVHLAMVRPSIDLGSLAKDHLKEVPFHFRQLLASTASPEELGDLLSYLMFSPGYVGDLIKLGERDAKAQHHLLQEGLQMTGRSVA